MYSKPTVERFGHFRDLTRFGSDFSRADMLSMGGPTTQDDSCNPNDPGPSPFSCPAAPGSR